MISPSSLSAFTPVISSATQATRVAAPTGARAAAATEQVQKPLQALPPGSAPARNTPRGSLLDLSV